MHRFLIALGAIFFCSISAHAADTAVSSETAASALDGTELYYCVQGGANRKCTGAQVKTLAITSAVRAVTGTSDTTLNTDQGKLVTFSNGSAITVTLPDPSGGNFAAGWTVSFRNLGAGTVTVNRQTSSTIDGANSFTLITGQGLDIYSDGTNYFTQQGSARIAAVSGLGTGVATAAAAAVNTNGGLLTAATAAIAANAIVTGSGSGTALTGTTPGTGVLTALAANISAVGGLPKVVAAGTSALGTSAISSGACATVVTTSATGTATTDVILVGFNGDPTGVTGYGASANGMLTIINYPSADNVNHKVCNNTGSSVTPGAVTLNWRVLR